MIFIDLEEFEPDSNWIALALEHAYCLDQEDDNSKAIYIQRNPIWTQLIDKWRRKYNKCWLTESRNEGSHAHIEHFRPKSRVSINEKVKKLNLKIAPRTGGNRGYWWLAYDWRNYRLAYGIPNSSKSTFFPLKVGSFISKGILDNELLEDNYLIDPTLESDVKLLQVEPSNGSIKPTADERGNDSEQWNYLRAKTSIAIYDLDNHWLVNGRMNVIKECQIELKMCLQNYNDYMGYIGDDVIAEKFLKNMTHYIDLLKNRTLKESPFSAAARSCIDSILEADEYADLRPYFQ